MILDAHNLFSDAQAVTATANSTNVIDSSVARDLGAGEEIYLVVMVDVAMTDSGSDSTVAVTLVTDDNASLSSKTTVQTIGTFAATSAAGSRFIAKLQPSALYERYIGVTYTVAGGDLSTGSFTAFLTKNIDAYRAYADNSTFTK